MVRGSTELSHRHLGEAVLCGCSMAAFHHWKATRDALSRNPPGFPPSLPSFPLLKALNDKCITCVGLL